MLPQQLVFKIAKGEWKFLSGSSRITTVPKPLERMLHPHSALELHMNCPQQRTALCCGHSLKQRMAYRLPNSRKVSVDVYDGDLSLRRPTYE